MSPGPISKSQQRLIHYLVRWWDRLARFTIPGMISRILVGIWQSLSCMYSCLISYCSNQYFDDAIHAHGWTQCWSLLAGCLLDLITISFIDMHMISCTASEVVLHLSRLHYRYCFHSFRHGCYVPMILFVEIGEFSRGRLTNSACNVPSKLKTCLAISTTPPGASTIPTLAKMACEKRKLARYSFPTNHKFSRSSVFTW